MGQKTKMLLGTYGKMGVSQLRLKLREQFGDIVRLTGMGRKDVVFLFDSADFEKMHRNESVWPFRQGLECMTYYQKNMRSDLFKWRSLAVAQGKEWYEMRSSVNPVMMQPRRTKMYVEPIVTIAEEFIERMKKIRDDKMELPSDFANELNKWALESIAYIALDTRLGCLVDRLEPDSRAQLLIAAVADMFDLFYRLDFVPSVWRHVSTKNWRKFVKTMDNITGFAYEIVSGKMNELQSRKDDGDAPKSVLEALLHSKNPEYAFGMAVDMLIAGIDTTSNTTGTALTLLATNPEKQEKLFEELARILPTKQTPITAEKLNDMKYLKAVIKESLRVQPIFPGNSRDTVKDLVIGGYQIPKGTRLLSAHDIACKDEKNFKQADKFIPERWLKSENHSDLDSPDGSRFAFLPFGFGPRMCIGRRFAELEIEVLLAKIMRNFRLSYHYGDMEWTIYVLRRPSKPLKFRAEERKT
ncbi:UNVERIFIED_CONTAM: hypothetical protein PYX00_000103 [Menopon gallinae]|uniref:Cytochrome P450 n=1 Tax=Menopon gallinae TaxID=328185 RepID=A0AAW2I796_9NEOP